jgi:hypothetical protein
MSLKIYDDSKNYTCQIIKLPVKISVNGLDNLVEVNHQGNSCLVGKDSDSNISYLFFPCESQISHDFLSKNNLYRHSELNEDKTKKGFFEDNRRVKAIKFKGVVSTGFIIPLDSLCSIIGDGYMRELALGNEFNEIAGTEVCKKFIRPRERNKGMSNPKTKTLDSIVDSKFVPEHMDTSHLLKNVHKLNLEDEIIVSYKLHGTSARYFNTLVKTSLTWKDKLAKWFGVKVIEEKYDYICASRRVIKSCGFEELPDKNHWFTSGDLWSEVGKQYFEGKLNQGEAIYCEIIGKTYKGEAIQHGYTYGFQKPEVFVYRISNINPQGIEVDLSYQQMKERCKQLEGVSICPEYYKGTLLNFLNMFTKIHYKANDDINLEEVLNHIFYNKLLEKPSVLDYSVVEEGFCIRKDGYPRPEIFKIKSKAFLLHEGHGLDKQVIDIEEEQVV